jgi:DNA-binding beta-propeller fold protein YncE
MSKQVARCWTTWSACFVFATVVVGVSARIDGGRVAAAGGSYRLVEGWLQVPATVPMGFVSWVDVDPNGLAYVFRRCPVKCSDGPHPAGSDPPGSVLMFNSTGKYLGEWEPKSGGKAKEAHGLHIDRHGFIWTTDVQLHVVKKYRADGTLLMTLGKVGVPGETPDTFNKPTNVFVASDDSIFVADGYGNQRVVKFGKDGKFVKTWGKKGTAPGEFRIPHAIVQDRSGRIIVADRCGLGETKCTDGRIQIFDTDGKYLTQWTPPGGAFAPFAVAVDVGDRLYIDDTHNSKVWILEAKSGKVLDTLDGVAGHGMAVSSSGDDIYITGSSAGVRRYSRARPQ